MAAFLRSAVWAVLICLPDVPAAHAVRIVSVNPNAMEVLRVLNATD